MPIRPCILLLIFASAVTAQPVVVGAGYTVPGPLRLAPGQVTTLFAAGLATTISSAQQATTLPLPASLADISVTIQQGAQAYLAPLFSVQQTSICSDQGTPAPECRLTAITIQVPFELAASIGPPENVASVVISEGGVASKPFPASIVPDNIHVLNSCDAMVSDIDQPPSTCAPIVTHADGTLVSVNTPAAPGETVVIYAVGLGRTVPAVATGAATPAPTGGVLSVAAAPNNVQFEYYPNASPSRPFYNGSLPPLFPADTFRGLVFGYVGLYQINVPIPTGYSGLLCLPPVVSNLTINLGGQTSFDGAPICISRQ